MISSRRYSAGLSAIVAAYVVLGISYALATPPLEASDEYKHYPVVQHVQTRRALPVLDPAEPGRWLQEGAQPPLYYVLMATLTAGIDTSDLAEIHQVNAHAFVGDPNQVANKNLILHRPEREQFPWRGAVLAIYLIRLASIGLGIGTVLVAAGLGARLFDRPSGLLAAALTAFNPMFLFVSAAVNNDSLAILLGSVGIYLLVRLWQQPETTLCDWKQFVLLGLIAGLGMLTKLNLGGFLVLTGLAVAGLSWRQRQWRTLFVGGAIVGTMALSVSAWWFLRNIELYGDPTGLTAFVAVQGVRQTALTWQDWREEFGTFYRSFWGLFGGVNVSAPEPAYLLCNAAAALGIAGLVRSWRQTSFARGGAWLPAAWGLILFVLLVRWNVISPAFQGRLIFPALAGLSALWAAGLLSWIRPAWRGRAAAGAAGLAFALAAILPWLAIRPAYAYPEPLSYVPEAAAFGPITFVANEDGLQLVGVEVSPDQSVTPGGDGVQVTLYWQVIQPVERDYLSTVHLLGRAFTSVGQVNRHPAWGMIPTSHWRPGEIWRDEYLVRVYPGATAPGRLRIVAGLFDTDSGQALPAIGPDGPAIDLLVVGEARLAAGDERQPQPPVATEVAFADGIVFKGYGVEPQPARPGDEVELALYWQASGRPSQDYTVFVHLIGPDDSQVAGADGPPVNNDYPTSFWRPGDELVDVHRLLLPRELTPGEYKVVVGMYDVATGARLPRLDGSGDAISWPLSGLQP